MTYINSENLTGRTQVKKNNLNKYVKAITLAVKNEVTDFFFFIVIISVLLNL